MNLKRSTIVFSMAFIPLIFFFSFDSKTSFTILATDYGEKSTEFYTYKGNKLVNTESYPIGGVESLQTSHEKVIFNKYGNDLMTLTDGDYTEYEIRANPLQIERYEMENYALHNEGINAFRFVIYDKDYNVVKESVKIEGYARNFIMNNGVIYVLANIYNLETNHRTVGIYTFDPKNLERLSFTSFEELTFGFYMERFDDKIEVYGHSDEKKKELTIYELDTDNLHAKLVKKSDVTVMWVNKSVVIGDKKYILNDYSIISIDGGGNLKVEFENGQVLIDFEYDEKEKCMYVLSGDFEKEIFQVQKLDQQFTLLETVPLKETKLTPTDLLLN
ncbi:hypothetical protein LCL95_10070 [Bacillus timonensis]|nr:hypothetical protein [Bacillus timonensis]